MSLSGFISRNVELGAPLSLSSWRKIAIGTWKTAGDPSVYGMLDFDTGPALAYIEKLRQASGLKITLSHFMGKALAETLARHPDINCILRFGRLYPRKTVDVFFQVATDSRGEDLSGTVIRGADRKSIPEIMQEMQTQVNKIRAHGDPEYRQMKTTMKFLPGVLSRFLINLSEWIMYGLNLWSPILGVPRDPFGSIMVTNIGSLGLDMAFAPLVPYSRVPILVAVGAVRETPIVKNGAVTIAQMSRLCVTFDHRLIDGVHASHMSRTLQKILADPEAELSG